MPGTRRSMQYGSNTIFYQEQRTQILKRQILNEVQTENINGSSREASHAVVFKPKTWEFFIPKEETRCQRAL